MFFTLSYEMRKYEHGLSAAEQRAADLRAGATAAALRDLRLHVGRTFRATRRVRWTRGAADAMTSPAQVLSSVR